MLENTLSKLTTQVEELNRHFGVLTGMLSPSTEATPTPPPVDSDAPIGESMKDELRSLLASAPQPKIAGLMKNFGANRISDIKVSEYERFLAEAKKLTTEQ